MENGLRVLIAGCDTFRAGAVEQLRTHTKHLNSIHPPQDGQPTKVYKVLYIGNEGLYILYIILCLYMSYVL